jgi:hypothetical protein
VIVPGGQSSWQCVATSSLVRHRVTVGHWLRTGNCYICTAIYLSLLGRRSLLRFTLQFQCPPFLTWGSRGCLSESELCPLCTQCVLKKLKVWGDLYNLACPRVSGAGLILVQGQNRVMCAHADVWYYSVNITLIRIPIRLQTVHKRCQSGIPINYDGLVQPTYTSSRLCI